MIKLVTISIFLLIGYISVAQQQSLFTNYLLNNYYYNPALAGSYDVHKANIAYRNQWVGFENSPVTFTGNFYGSHKNQQKIGYGVSVVSERVGLIQNTGVYVNYAQHFKIGGNWKFALGIKPGYVQYRIRLYDAQLADQGDDVLTGNILSSNAIDFNGGIHIYSDKWNFSVAAHQLFGSGVNFTSFNQSLSKHYTAILSYLIKKEKKKWDYQPTLMVRYVNPAKAQITGMIKATYKNKFWGGLLLRTDDAVGAVIGLKISNKLEIGYGFDYSLGIVKGHQGGTHEISISLITSKTKPTIEEEDEELNKSLLEDEKSRMKKDKNE